MSVVLWVDKQLTPALRAQLVRESSRWLFRSLCVALTRRTDGRKEEPFRLNSSRVTVFNINNGRENLVAKVRTINHSHGHHCESEKASFWSSAELAMRAKAAMIPLVAIKIVPDTLINTVDVRVYQ